MKKIVFQMFFLIVAFSVAAGTVQIENSSVINSNNGDKIGNSGDESSKIVSGIQSEKINIKNSKITNNINGTIKNNAVNGSFINTGITINGSEVCNSVINNTTKGKIDINADNNSSVNAGILAENVKVINSNLTNLVHDTKIRTINGAKVNCGIKLS